MSSCTVRPSEVSDRKFVSIPPEEEVVDRNDWEECGKWIIVFLDRDMSFVDRTWAVLQPLQRDGTLLMVKAATALLGREVAVVQCFVRGGPEEAKRTAGLIRAAVDYHKGIMYYKANKVAWASVARRHGHKNVSRYMYTYMGSFYVRDPWGGWSLETENGQGDVSIPSKFRKENYSGSEKLPSMSPTTVVILQSSSRGGDGNWYLHCRSSEKDPEYLAESHRVWIVARELLREGHFTKISWGKNGQQQIEIRLYVPTGSSLTGSGRNVPTGSRLDACDKIFREASVRRMMYFRRGTEGHNQCNYKYTPEGELYELTEFGEKFVLQRSIKGTLTL